ncbi:MAG TPA: HIT family protein [Pyrinomonadaceae bacterium]|nr:HIT family protein [Pyrinomonadaceae bacterium]
MYKPDCPFCDFSGREALVYEDGVAFAVISLRPTNRHHVMVIPREHYESFVELPDELASHTFLLCKRLSAAVRRVSRADAVTHISDDDVNGSWQNRVAHYKFHIMPRFRGDGVEINWNREEAGTKARAEFARQIREELLPGGVVP